jgi:fatty-acyl-CoA synthase
MHEFLEVPTLPDLLVRACSQHSDRPAITVDAATQTFGELLDRASLVARGLAALGVRAGTRVGLYMPNSQHFVEYMFAASMLGAVVVPINNRFRSRELLHVQADAQLAVIVTVAVRSEVADHPARLQRLLDDLPAGAPRPVVIVADAEAGSDGMMGAAELAARAQHTDQQQVEDARAHIRLRDLAAILYTSGTTAMPKGCLHTHEALVRNGIVTGRTRFALTEQDRFWDPLPMFHVSFLTPLIACIDAGTQILSMARFEPELALDMMESQRVTWVFASFQAIARGLTAAGSFGHRDLSSVRMSMCVGHAPELREFQRAFAQAQLLSTYGSTETGGVITYHEPGATAEERVSTCGTPFRGVRLAIKDLESERRLGPDEVGEILVHGYSVLDGYLNDPGATGVAIDEDGWLHTGDLGELTGSGHLIFHGRLKDMIKVGGENVSAAEVEAVLTEHPAVLVAHVVAAPDARLDEVVAAFVELAPGQTAAEAELTAHCASQIAGYKVPRYFRFVTEWPMSATKVRKEDLRDRIRAELLAAAAKPA